MQGHGQVQTCDLGCLDAVVFGFDGKDHGKSCGGDVLTTTNYATRPARCLTDFLRSQVYLRGEGRCGSWRGRRRPVADLS